MEGPTEPCPVCGIPGQVCPGSAPPPHHIIGANIFPSLGHEDIFIVETDVWEDRTIVAAMLNEDGVEIVAPKVTRVQIAHKGDALRMSEARRLGLLNS